MNDDEFLQALKKAEVEFETGESGAVSQLKNKIQQAMLASKKAGLSSASTGVSEFPQAAVDKVISWARQNKWVAKQDKDSDQREMRSWNKLIVSGF